MIVASSDLTRGLLAASREAFSTQLYYPAMLILCQLLSNYIIQCFQYAQPTGYPAPQAGQPQAGPSGKTIRNLCMVYEIVRDDSE